ncbi:hypothetical protein FE784_39710 [Paenibacillus hemerocallicola]|uniref:Uncharacterized protein n=1 Tax=Paenibacillus hemerocallicola TaxID=1172614 RepID=A0A5C4SV98_9BACL|nr:hypothetical protein [Paenibacillus hemerocallicola]TNJ54786.1 hypothetical protein FE784_39710 [Paenibacillus hemerocallicola]
MRSSKAPVKNETVPPPRIAGNGDSARVDLGPGGRVIDQPSHVVHPFADQGASMHERPFLQFVAG